MTKYRVPMTWLEIIGWAAVVGVAGNYLALVGGYISLWWYALTGVLAGIGVGASLYHKKAWPAFCLNAWMMGVSAFGVLRLW